MTILLKNNVEQNLLKILQTEILRQELPNPLIVPLGQMGKLMQLAKEHAVLGLLAHAVYEGKIKIDTEDAASAQHVSNHNGQKQKLVMNLMQVELLHQRKYKDFTSVLVDLATLMDSHGIRYVVFKGVTVARHYPMAYTRTMGDVDFYVPASDFDRAVEAFETSWKVTIDKEDIDKHFSFDYQGIRFEMHYQIETFGNGRHQRYFNRMIDQSIAKCSDNFCIPDSDGKKVKLSVLPPTEDLVVVFKHWFNHLLVEGVGLRQTTDLVVLLKAYQDKISVARMMTALDRIGYGNAFRAMLAMMRKYFGLNGVDSFCVLDSNDERYADMLMTTILESGNFGRKVYKNHSAGKKKSIETATKAFRHCMRFFRLAPMDIFCLMPKRIMITLKTHIFNNSIK